MSLRKKSGETVDADFLEMVQHACTRPAMYVGTASFEKLSTYLEGYAAGLSAQRFGQHHDNIFYPYFQRFLVLKYGMEAAIRQAAEDKLIGEPPEEEPLHPLYGPLGWPGIYKAHFRNATDEELFALFKKDFEDFANPLTRMAIEVT
jgi:hypothetical protein